MSRPQEALMVREWRYSTITGHVLDNKGLAFSASNLVAEHNALVRAHDEVLRLIAEAIDTHPDTADPIKHNKLLVHYMQEIERAALSEASQNE